MRVRPSPWRRARLIIGTVVLAIVCVLAFFMVLVPFVLGAQSYTVLTGSMKPALEPGHLIAVRDTPIDEISPGDIVTFQLESGKPTVATHRVIGVGHSADGERLLITQGDANNVQDKNPVQEVQLRGVLVYAIPWLGYINVWATPSVKSILVTVIGVGAIGWGLIVLLKDTGKRRRVVKAGTAAAAAVLLAVLSPAMPEAQAATADHPLLLSADGTTWMPGPDLTLLDASARVVPGDDIPVDFWVRNDSNDSAEFTITSAWTPSDPTDAGDVTLAADLTSPQLHAQPIDGGDSVRVPLSAEFTPDSENSTLAASATLTVTVTLVQTGSEADPDPLATTGAEFPTILIVAAAVLLGAGLILIIIRVIAGRRRNRRD